MSESGIAGQVTLIHGDLDRLECECSNLAKISLPVPLSPCNRTGTVVSATRSSFSRADVIVDDCPKITSIGGRSRRSINSVACAKGMFWSSPGQGIHLVTCNFHTRPAALKRLARKCD